MKNFLLVFLLGNLFISCANKQESGKFLLADSHVATNIYVDPESDPLILWATEELSKDVKQITGKKPNIIKTTKPKSKGIYIGTFQNQLIKKLELNDSDNNSWESFKIQQKEENVIITGSDVRGTVYGIFELTERLGVSPWQWWADVVPAKKEILDIHIPTEGITESPSVEYRGIFLNDEDWGLQPWAAKTFEPETGDIGPKTYEKIFQLLLRLKANTIWPAMHPCTQGFFTVEGNGAMAEKYHMVIGTSHAEPMMRNNVAEWNHEFGKYDYSTNKERINEYWQSRIAEIKEKNVNTIMTLGMRGIHDSGMEGVSSLAEGMAFVDTIMTTQRSMLSNTLEIPITKIPQVFIPYKEVLNIYDEGLQVPEDVTLMWTDDNYGYIRRLSNEEEQKRIGGSGVYYHLSYWGRPHDYLWLSTTQPGLIWYEMQRAYANGAKKIWIANVGDIKPGEYNMEFFLDMAWDINSIKSDGISDHMEDWAAREFGADVAHEVKEVMNEYYRLAFLRRPEFMGWSQTEPTTKTKLSSFTSEAAMNRIKSYNALVAQIERLTKQIPKEKLAAWFQLVEYPVKGAALMNQKFLYHQLANTTNTPEKEYLQNSQTAYQKITKLTAYYNKEMLDGKWNNMMSMKPRNLPVFDSLPSRMKQKEDGKLPATAFQGQFKNATDFNDSQGNWQAIDGFGFSNKAITLFPLKTAYFTDDKPWVSYDFNVEKPGDYMLELRFTPTHANNFDHSVTIEINSVPGPAIELNTKGRSQEWKENVLRNSKLVRIPVGIEHAGKNSFKVYVNQTGIVLDQLALTPKDASPYYEIPVH